MPNDQQDQIGPYAIGDLVQLRSGGPTMTVDLCRKSNANDSWIVHLTWFDSKGAIQQIRLLSDTLQLAKVQPDATHSGQPDATHS